MSTKLRGVRGATTVTKDDTQEILQATETLVSDMVQQNNIEVESIASVWMTMTQDLTATFPARCLRHMSGWTFVPVMCAQEVAVPGSLEKCIRVMIHYHTDRAQHEIRHVYQNKATSLRPDLSLT
ncbi:chorismate mutase [Caldalkalibacillus salinus]|uniref:chorismate mutase n=1 Tax=Caldalkalibacillus salinus TaxID=2803787 RepID=UPI00192247B1|nr:chorismate mutase [Caldalkalibacillus salinus]